MKFLTTSQLADTLQISESAFRTLIRQGGFRAFGWGREPFGSTRMPSTPGGNSSLTQESTKMTLRRISNVWVYPCKIGGKTWSHSTGKINRREAEREVPRLQ